MVGVKYILVLIIIGVNIITPTLKMSNLRLRSRPNSSVRFRACSSFHFVRAIKTVDQWLFEPGVLYLPKVQAKNTDVIIVAKRGVWLIFGVVYFGMNPLPLVIRIVNDPRFPLSLRAKEELCQYYLSILLPS